MADWKKQPNRKPLVLRGARQVGKTSLVNLFGNDFSQYIYLNLELPQDRALFENSENIDILVQAIFLTKRKNVLDLDSLLFIDEIQAYPSAIEQLRYFYEFYPNLFVIAAGSLLETVFDTNISFPVGRVDSLHIRPLTFQEFLNATGEDQVIKLLNEIPIPSYAHGILLELFHTYTLLGGMPEIIAQYAKHKNISALTQTYDSILVPYIEDIAKYAANASQASVLRHLIQSGLTHAGERIVFEGFGNSNYKSREVGEAFRTLEKSFFLQLVYPVTETVLPISPNNRKSPRIQALDTGLGVYFSGIQANVIQLKDLNDAFRGRIAEHVVYQELLAKETSVLRKLHFWVRDKSSSQAEVDLVYPYKTYLIPLEIKSGATGKLRSLFEFMERSPHNMAVRLYAGKPTLDEFVTPKGKSIKLLNLPYYAVSKLDEYITWAFKI
mgnify:CR=1 FL=1